MVWLGRPPRYAVELSIRCPVCGFGRMWVWERGLWVFAKCGRCGSEHQVNARFLWRVARRHRVSPFKALEAVINSWVWPR